MVGRNDPCPCGSGKKYKKCHGKEQTLDIREAVERETAIIRRRFIDDGMEIRHIQELDKRAGKWFPALKGVFPPQVIADLLFNTYAYVENQELWTVFVEHELRKSHRPLITKMLEAWLHPFWLLARVVNQDAKELTVEDELSGKVYTTEPMEGLEEGDWLFGIAFHDPDSTENRLYESESLMGFFQRRNEAIEVVRSKLENFDGDSLGLYLSFKNEKDE